MPGKFRAISLIVLAEVLALSVWFSATAVIPVLTTEFALAPEDASALTTSVSFGFVAGTIVSAVFGLADRLNPKVFFAASVVFAALVNGAVALCEPGSGTMTLLRFLTGAAMAGAYPVGMKMASSWAERDMGWLIGLLVGAVTLGSAMPHLLGVLDVGGVIYDWRLPVLGASILALLSGGMILFVELGPNLPAATKLRAGDALKAFTVPSVRYANFGYFGHMWELYAMWGWIGLFLSESMAANSVGEDVRSTAALITFVTLASGGVGCVLGGRLADRLGRTTVTIAAMAISGGCCLIAGFLFGTALWILVPFIVIWGMAVVADSAQFSSSVIELSDPQIRGTMLTVQTCVGFLITTVTIQLVPLLLAAFGWTGAFGVLAIGPILGVVAMWRLRCHPDSVRLAGGRR